MDAEKKAIQIALKEINKGTFQDLPELLADHKLKYLNKWPEIARVRTDSVGELYSVYFKLKDGPDFLVIGIDTLKEKPFNVYLEPHARVYLRILSKKLNENEITDKLGIEPTEIRWTKFYYEHPDKYKFVWLYEPQKDFAADVEEKLSFMIDKLSVILSNIKIIQEDCIIILDIFTRGTRYSAAGFSLEPAILKQLSGLGIRVDIDLDSSGP